MTRVLPKAVTYLPRGCNNIVGVYISPEQVRLAQPVTPKVERADSIAFLEETGERVDLIICMDVIEHLCKEEALRLGIFAWNLIETEEIGPRVVTQMLIASAVKPR